MGLLGLGAGPERGSWLTDHQVQARVEAVKKNRTFQIINYESFDFLKGYFKLWQPGSRRAPKGERVGAGADVRGDALSAIWSALRLLGLTLWTQSGIFCCSCVLPEGIGVWELNKFIFFVFCFPWRVGFWLLKWPLKLK